MNKLTKNKVLRAQAGFTLIEILVVIGIVAVLATIVIVAINPARQFAQTRNTQRTSNVSSILNAIGQKMADCKGKFNATATECPTSPACPTLTASTTYNIASSGTGSIDLSCLTPTYIPSGLPYDPSATGASWTSSASYDTKYSVVVDANGRYTVSAPSAELSQTIAITR